jgi:hypothetical protein
MLIHKTHLCDLHNVIKAKAHWAKTVPGDGVPFREWKMEIHDAPIFEYIYSQLNPKRHLEFGTWYGYGACLVAKNSDATIWTMNLWEGEKKPNGENAYGSEPISHIPNFDSLSKKKTLLDFFCKKRFQPSRGSKTDELKKFKSTDSGEFIGRLYREKGFGNRVNQIYCNSMDWDNSAYPDGFFDTVLIDGGHGQEIVTNDTIKSLSLLKTGGAMMWHDYCPDEEIVQNFSTCKGVVDAIQGMSSEICKNFESLHWIFPSFILIGIKK